MGTRDRHRQRRGEHAGHDRGAGAPDDPREDVAAELVGAEQVVARRVREERVEVRCGGEYGAIQGARSAASDEAGCDGEAGDRERPPREPPPEEPPPARARRQDVGRGDVDVAHDRASATTRMRGFRSEYMTSTSRLTTT